MGVRAENRQQMDTAILTAGRRHLASVGPTHLSLRSIAREVGLSSSAVYRYVSSRDELLTRLILSAYNELGTAVESGVDDNAPPRVQWRAACHALRTWARDNPNEWALIYGTPVPGYVAPQNTIDPATRVAAVLGRIAAAAQPPSDDPQEPTLRNQLSAVESTLGLTPNLARTAQLVSAWSQLIGTISLELFGHFVGSVDPADAYWKWLVEDIAIRLGLPEYELAGRHGSYKPTG